MFYYHGWLRVAANMAMEYISAALGYGPEHFGLKQTLTTMAPPMSINLPLNVIDALIYEMGLQNKDNPDKPLEKVCSNYIFSLILM